MSNTNNKSTVALVQCDSYDNDKVYKAITKAIELICVLDLLINKKILVKPNLLSGSDPNEAITTNPAVFEAVLKYLKENGYSNIAYGDSPSGISNMEEVVRVAGVKQRAKKYDVPL